jgi:hypothetical protein
MRILAVSPNDPCPAATTEVSGSACVAGRSIQLCLNSTRKQAKFFGKGRVHLKYAAPGRPSVPAAAERVLMRTLTVSPNDPCPARTGSWFGLCGWTLDSIVFEFHSKTGQIFVEYPACSVGWWLMAGAGLF